MKPNHMPQNLSRVPVGQVLTLDGDTFVTVDCPGCGKRGIEPMSPDPSLAQYGFREIVHKARPAHRDVCHVRIGRT